MPVKLVIVDGEVGVWAINLITMSIDDRTAFGRAVLEYRRCVTEFLAEQDDVLFCLLMEGQNVTSEDLQQGIERAVHRCRIHLVTVLLDACRANPEVPVL